MKESEERFIEEILKIGAKLPQEVVGHHPRIFVRALRKRLRMTQKQLAKRAGVLQSYIAKIESGNKNPTLDTLEKIFRALNCSITLLLIPEIEPEIALQKQAYEAAKKKIQYLAGTMALEEQLPTKEALQHMLEEEIKKLLDSKTSKIWDV